MLHNRPTECLIGVSFFSFEVDFDSLSWQFQWLSQEDVYFCRLGRLGGPRPALPNRVTRLWPNRLLGCLCSHSQNVCEQSTRVLISYWRLNGIFSKEFRQSFLDLTIPKSSVLRMGLSICWKSIFYWTGDDGQVSRLGDGEIQLEPWWWRWNW